MDKDFEDLKAKISDLIINGPPIGDDTTSVVEEIERLGIEETALMLKNIDGLSWRAKSKAKKIKERLEDAADTLIVGTKGDIPVRLARIIMHVYQELDFKKVIHFVSVFGNNVRELRNQSDYNRYAEMATDLLQKGAEYFTNKHFPDLELKDCTSTEQLICVSHQAWNIGWDWSDEHQEMISKYRSEQIKKYLTAENRNPCEEQWCRHSLKRSPSYEHQYFLPVGYEKFHDEELYPHLEKIQKENFGFHGFLQEYQNESKMGLHVSFILMDHYFHFNLLEMLGAVADSSLRIEYRLYILYLFAQIERVEPDELYSHALNQIEREKMQNQAGNKFWAHFFSDPHSTYNPGFDDFIEVYSEMQSRVQNRPLLDDMDIEELQRVSIEMLRSGFKNGKIKTDNPIFDTYNIQIMMVAIAILASQMTKEEMDPMELIGTLSDGVIYNDAYLQITDRAKFRKKQAVISLVCPEHFIADAVQLLFKYNVTPEGTEAIVREVFRLTKEGLD